MKSTVKAGIKDDKYIMVMDKKIDDLRRKIWVTIFEFKNRGDLSDCDIAMALGCVQYELIHHSDE